MKPTTTIKRWDLESTTRFNGEPWSEMVEDSMGDWVLFEEHEEQLAQVRADALEEAAQLCERVRCRQWSPRECAAQIRSQLKGDNNGRQEQD